MLHINIRTIPHSEQRYDTVGDWQWVSGDKLYISISDLGSSYKELLVAIHELVEVYLCRIRGINQADVDQFDLEFEARREPGNVDEPGDHPMAPYKQEHFFATNIERMLCHEFGIDWSEYEKTIYSL